MENRFFLASLFLNIINEFEKSYIYSPSLHQDLYQKLIKDCSNYTPINIIPNMLNEEDRDSINEEIAPGEKHWDIRKQK